MSLFSRLFRKTPSLPTPAPTPQSAPSEKISAAERARAAVEEDRALQSAIDGGDMQAVMRLVVAGTSTRVRQAAARTIEDPEILRQLIRDIRGGNDKSVYKILTAKRDAQLEQARKLEELQVEINAAAEALERHSQRAYDALYSRRLDQFERRWEALAAQADPALRDKVQQWIDRSREIGAEPLRQAAAQAARELAVANAAAEKQRLREEQQAQTSVAVAEPVQLVEQQKPVLTEEQQAEQKIVREIGGLIRKAREALSAGSTSHASGLRRTIEEKLAGAPPASANLASQLEQLDQQLTELKDWKSFSVAPKRAELIAEMELLVEATLDPLALAERIKSLQDEWRILSKGASEGPEEDWQRFQAASKKAYEPCSEYFAAQALVRKENLQRRDALLTGLLAFEAGQNWEQPDWQSVIKALRETKQEWRNCSPVERQAGKQQQEKFDALAASLQGRLDAEYTRNQQTKESLIERASQALASNDGRKAIDAIKDLQQKWKIVGPLPREIDQRLWTEFRQHCDAVFQKREQESAAFTAGLEENQKQAIALCEQIETIAALEGPELLASAATLATLRSSFEALGEFPRANTRELRNRFDKGLERCEKSFARQRVRDAERSWSDLFEAANHVRAYKLAVARGVDAEQIDTLKAAAESYIASVQKWPKSGLDTIKKALANEHSADLAANEEALKLLCIRAEMLTDMPTPPEDQPLRREYQLKRLVQNMGQGVKTDAVQLDAMEIEWIGVGPVDEAVYQPLLQRFRRCRERDNAKA